ncbi:hypothetical protein HZB02_07455 [Candidatus Woesearchaeota archaeon]|nr:hypothetical protein [Candidatus Woesearchaeota archaeon]
MQAILITFSGMEAVAQQEVKELLGVKATIHPSAVIFSAKRPEDFAKLSYLARSARRVLLFLAQGTITSLDDIPTFIKDIDLAPYITPETTVAVRAEREGSHTFTSTDIEKEVAQHLLKGIKVDLSNPQLTIFVFVKDQYVFVGIDVAGFDLSKRDYKIFTLGSSLRGPVAYGFLRLMTDDGFISMIDPYSTTGTIAIEAASFSMHQSLHSYGKQKFSFPHFLKINSDAFLTDLDAKAKTECAKILAFNPDFQPLSAVKKNIRVAGLHKQITCSRVDADWLDVKLDKGGVEIIAVHLKGRKDQLADVQKQLKELFHQAEYVLNKKGRLGIITHLQLDKFPETKLSPLQQGSIFQGAEELRYWIYQKI